MIARMNNEFQIYRYLQATHQVNLSCVVNERNMFTSVSQKSNKRSSFQHFIIQKFDENILRNVYTLAMNHNINL